MDKNKVEYVTLPNGKVLKDAFVYPDFARFAGI